MRRVLVFLLAAGLGLVGNASIGSAPSPPPTAPDVLVVGGGPDRPHNQVAIESNVRYVLGLFSRAATRTALFADGDSHSRTVAYEDPPAELTTEEAAMELLLSRAGYSVERIQFREPHLPQIDGPASKKAVDSAFSQLGHPARPIVLYFTGHGSQDKTSGAGNAFLLWHEELSAHEMSDRIAQLPTGVPVVLIMAQCFSGAFAMDILSGGKPGSPPIPQDMAGFFGTTADRVAAGCTPDIREKDYQDFTTHFMAALSGKDRLGTPVTGADYNHDGQVGMDEAFCYALIHDLSIDVPVCTSDAFLRDRVKSPEMDLFRTPLSEIRSWATPAQRTAIDALATEAAVEMQGKGAAGTSPGNPPSLDMVALYRKVAASGEDNGVGTRTESEYEQALTRFNTLRGSLRQKMMAAWPALQRRRSPSFADARKSALADLSANHAAEAAELVRASRNLDRLTGEWEKQAIAVARQLRLLRLVKTVSLAHQLLSGPPGTDRQDLLRILKAEQRPLFHGDQQFQASHGRSRSQGSA